MAKEEVVRTGANRRKRGLGREEREEKRLLELCKRIRMGNSRYVPSTHRPKGTRRKGKKKP